MSTVASPARPGLGRLYLKAMLTARGRHGDRLPETTSESTVAVDRDRLAQYALVCGFRQGDLLPPTYPHILAFPQQVSLMVSPDFPFALAGMVHVGNRITQRRPLRADERLTLRVHAADLRPHPRGRQFDMITEALVEGELLWSEASIYLRREKASAPSASATPTPAPGPHPDATPNSQPSAAAERPAPSAIWRVPASIGRRYAAVSGDINPIHINPLAARLFGFSRSIAHGMWLKARCLAALEGRLPEALVAQVEFKSPLLLPSTVAFSSQSADEGWTFSVVHASSGRPHLLGQAGPAG